jgi:protein-S-isoprenylcysteine O-methyltransferase Ste14
MAALFLGTLVIVTVVEVWQSTKHRPEATARDSGSRLVIRIGYVAGVFAAIVALRDASTKAIRHDRVLVFAVAIAILWSGMALRWWAFRTLGRLFTFTVTTTSDQPIVNTGPCRVLRHPSYAGAMLMLTGAGLAYANWLSLAAMVVLPLVGIAYRINVEEAALRESVGSAYESYSSTRKRLIPFVW